MLDSWQQENIKTDLLQRMTIRVALEQIVDTIMAGDFFSAGYLGARLTGKNPSQSAVQGHLVAGTVIQYLGAIIPLDTTPKLLN